MKKSVKILCVVLAMTLCGCAQSTQQDPTEVPTITLVAPEMNASVDLNNSLVQAFLEGYKDESGVGSSQDFAGMGDIYAMESLELSWTAVAGMEQYTVYLSTDPNLADPVIFTCTENKLSVPNMLTGRTWYWKVTSGNEFSAIGQFTLTGNFRLVNVDGVSNIRDLGGAKCKDGKTMKMGVVYRSANLDSITETGKNVMLEDFGIRTDLDLRKEGEGTAGSGSPLGESVQYIHIANAPYYGGESGIQRPDFQDALVQELRVFADADNFPVVIHCAIGRDRTGTLAYLLKAVCGVSLLDITKDYELSMLSYMGARDGSKVSALLVNFDQITAQLMRQEGKNLQQKTVNFMLSIGLTEQEITAIQNNLTQ